MCNYFIYLWCNKNWTRGSQALPYFLIFQLLAVEEKWYYILWLQIYIFEISIPSDQRFQNYFFCKPCAFIKDKKIRLRTFEFHFVFAYFEDQKYDLHWIFKNWAYDKCKYMKDKNMENARNAIWLCSIIFKKNYVTYVYYRGSTVNNI